jgi:hypothetical protein
MKTVGILAYGSLQDDPGKEIDRLLAYRVENVETTFKIEFARSSVSRGGAPTLIPVTKGGSKNRVQILVLQNGVSIRKAKNMLLRRETHNPNGSYRKPRPIGRNTVLIKTKRNFHNIDVVLYTKIEPNITPLTPQRLAERALESARSKNVAKGKDGITYLIQAKRNGIHTPLMPKYEKEILVKTKAESLEEALSLSREEKLSK